VHDKKILIVGMGSDILTDDGIGAKVAKKLSCDPYFEKHDFHYELLFNLDLGEKLSNYETVIFIDGSIQKEYPSGHVEINILNTFKETLHLTNIHEMKFQDCFSFWKNIGYSVPENIYIISIEVEDYLNFGSGISLNLSKCFNEIVKQIKQWLHHISISEKAMST
jgi:hydrogenase maturation protease